MSDQLSEILAMAVAAGIFALGVVIWQLIRRSWSSRNAKPNTTKIERNPRAEVVYRRSKILGAVIGLIGGGFGLFIFYETLDQILYDNFDEGIRWMPGVFGMLALPIYACVAGYFTPNLVRWVTAADYPDETSNRQN